MIHLDRLEAANKVAKTLRNTTYRFVAEKDKLYLEWEIQYKGNVQHYKMLCKILPGSHYFFGSRQTQKLEAGGVGESALVQLARWIHGANVLPLSWWRYCSGTPVMLWQDADLAEKALSLLTQARYPLE